MADSVNSGSIKILKASITDNIVAIDYQIDGRIEKYFSNSRSAKWIYDVNVSDVPESIAIIPFVCNVLPIVWLTDAVLEVDLLDKAFYESIADFKAGYVNMYPMLPFNGKVLVRSVEENHNDNKNTACFFSGGVDAYTTLLEHIDEKPTLMCIWGADIPFDDEQGFSVINKQNVEVSEQYNLQYHVIRSDFREIVNTDTLGWLVRKSNDGWWHGFQHGIAIISAAAPLAYVNGIGLIYIASSFPEEMAGQYTCASDPTIDNYVHFGNTSIFHDGRNYDRQGKVRFLVKKSIEGMPMKLHVCWEEESGVNCCKCEKCCRTLLEIISEGGNPNRMGFIWNKRINHRCKRFFLTELERDQAAVDRYYRVSQRRLIENWDIIPDVREYLWLRNMDMDRFNEYPMKKIRRSKFSILLRKMKQKMIGR